MGDAEWAPTSKHVDFTIKFSGDALKTHEIDANELATSLVGVSNALEEANQFLQGSYSDIYVKVRGSPKPGSFEIDIVSLLTCTGIQAFINVVELIGFLKSSQTSLIDLCKFTKGKQIESKKDVGDNKLEVSVDNSSDTIIANNYVVNIYENKKVMDEMKKVPALLSNEGYDEITFTQNGKIQNQIKKEQKDYFTSANSDTEELVNEGTDYFVITQANYNGEESGWKLRFETDTSESPRNDFKVKIVDTNFLSDVYRKRIIISNEEEITIKANYRKTTRKKDRIRSSWEILEVIDVIKSSVNEKNTGPTLDYYQK